MYYISKMQIPAKGCGCQDAKKGTKLHSYQWIKARKWTLNGKDLLSQTDLENDKYFEKCQN